MDDILNMVMISFTGICSVKCPFLLLAEGTLSLSATQSSRWRKLMQLFEHMQSDSPWNKHKRGWGMFYRRGHSSKISMCLYFAESFRITFMPLKDMFSAGTMVNKWTAWMPSKYWQFIICLNSHQDNSKTKIHLNLYTQYRSIWNIMRHCIQAICWNMLTTNTELFRGSYSGFNFKATNH